MGKEKREAELRGRGLLLFRRSRGSNVEATVEEDCGDGPRSASMVADFVGRSFCVGRSVKRKSVVEYLIIYLLIPGPTLIWGISHCCDQDPFSKFKKVGKDLLACHRGNVQKLTL